MDFLLENKKSRHDYTTLETLQAGIVLSGQEVKSLRAKRAHISEAFVRILSGEVYLVNARIEQLSSVAHVQYDPTRSRKLLLQKKQIRTLQEKIETKRLVAYPIAIGLEKNFIKVLIGIGKGKKTFERKKELQARDLEREARRDLKSKNMV